MDKLNSFVSYNGVQEVYQHRSETNKCDMTFAIFLPQQVKSGTCPVIWYLSGLTCTHANVMEKGEYRQKASELGLIIVCPDTSPRGENIPDDKEDWQFGSGAGFYLDAQETPYKKNYNMYSYITKELPKIISDNFSVDMGKQGIMGHSMGGHGALTIALKNSKNYTSCSAFAPIVQPSSAEWSKKAFQKYLGDDEGLWRQYDATLLIEDGYRFNSFLVDQGGADPFLRDGLRPELLKDLCQRVDQPLELRIHDGYDHSYYFISTFMDDHLAWHNEKLRN